MPPQNDLVAVLIDADNVSPARIGAVMTEIAQYGTASVKRIYGDWTSPNLNKWKKASDSDFTRLASRIREDGVTVYGFGEDKTPDAFRNACDRFTYLEVLDEPATDAAEPAPAKARVPTDKLRTDGALVGTLRAAIASASGDDGWAHLSVVGSLARKQRPDFDSRNWGYAKLSELVRAIGLFEVATRPGGGGVRVKNAGRSAK